MITVGNQIADMRAILPTWSCNQPDKRTAIWHGTLTPHKTTYEMRVKAKGLYDLYRDLSQDGRSDGQV